MVEYPRYELALKGGYQFLVKHAFGGATEVRFTTNVVAFAFDVSMGSLEAVLVKHGEVATVNDYVREYRKRMLGQKTEFARQMASGIRFIVLPEGFDVAEINRCIHNSGYLTVLLKRVWPEALLPSFEGALLGEGD